MEKKEEKLHSYRQVELEILREFRKICDDLGLKYYLTAGTLLGAVRHQGFIPWDDDIDIAMPREDYDRFARLGQRQLSKEYFYQSSETDPNFPLYFSKIRKLGTYVEEPAMQGIAMEQGIFIDIFPLDKCPRNPWLAKLFFFGIRGFGYVIHGKVDQKFTLKKEWYVKIPFYLLNIFSVKQLIGLRKMFHKFMALFPSDPCLCTVGGSHGYPKETYQSQWFAETVELTFEGETFCAPIGWDLLLQNMYGDYMTPPEEREKTGHFAL